MTSTKRRRGAMKGAPGREELETTLDTLAIAIDVSKNKKLLKLFEFLEAELDALDGDAAIMQRALKRTKKRRRK